LLEGRAPGRIGELVLAGYHGERGGDVILVAKPFLIPSGGTSGTTHGSPWFYDTHVPVLFYGAGFKLGRFAGDFRVTDIAPTLSAALRVVPPPGSVGRAWAEVLR